MVSQPRTGSFSPNPTAQTTHIGLSYSPYPSSHTGPLSVGASPSANSPTGSGLTKIVLTQVYLLLSTIKVDKDDPHKWDAQTESLRKVRLLPPPGGSIAPPCPLPLPASCLGPRRRGLCVWSFGANRVFSRTAYR